MTPRTAYLTFGGGIAAIATVLLGGQALLGMVIGSDGLASMPPAVISFVANLLLFGIIATIAAVMLARERRLSGVAGPAAGRDAGIGVLLGLAGIGLAAAQAIVAGTLTAADAGVGEQSGGGGWLMLGLLAIIVQAGGEEFAFRGWLQPLLLRAGGVLPALLLPTLAFMMLHLVGGARSPIAMTNLFLGGLWFALLALRSGGIALPAAAHIVWNASEQLLLGLDPNPGVGTYGAFVDFDLVGNGLWGGSDQGLNGSLGTTAVLIAMILPLAVWQRPALTARA